MQSAWNFKSLIGGNYAFFYTVTASIWHYHVSALRQAWTLCSQFKFKISAFSCSSLSNITYPDSLERVGRGMVRYTAFAGDESNWENGLLYIGKHLVSVDENFSGRLEIKEGTLTAAEITLDSDSECTALIVPDSVRCIQMSFQYIVENFTEIVLPQNAFIIHNIESFQNIEEFASKFGIFTVENGLLMKY